ncbi:MBL fold metallo-hydrolase [candidate division TA06 bacterium]|uniref:MBL fold metallo-hydrolase n=1 Tax=candidate division TA06 bacterium TaxID=2250710 RepID=A0A523UXX6_UNCT6|nr:MAG: MBL fold metallo-hydrolase [candidate division TA06 bacterium]
MKIKWLGHASFLITPKSGHKILTDPYKSGSYGGAVRYKKIHEHADIVLISHDHEDHNDVSSLPGDPVVLKGAGDNEAKGFKFKGVATYHDECRGRERGDNTIFLFEADGLTVCHLGDLGHTLSEEEIADIGKVDILFVPVGGLYTIDAEQATTVVKALQPKLVIPMHYKTEKLGFDIDGVEKFLEGKEGVKRQGSPEMEFAHLEDESQIVVLDHAM